MRNFAICGSNFNGLGGSTLLDSIDIEGVTVRCGLVQTPDLEFDRHASQNHDKVLVKVTAFSCNYRDKSLILQMATLGPATSFYVIGSEFVAEVIDLGPGVTGLQVGDRVISNGSYPRADVEGVVGGLPTNHGSKEYQMFHWCKLLKIPPEMPDEVAAAFPIGAQTSYSMIRKLNLAEGDDDLVTAARSNTSQFAINALRKYPVNDYATTTSGCYEAELKELGVRQLIKIDPNLTSFMENETLKAIALEAGGFDAVIDPFFDVHLRKVLPVMAPGGRYITCGMYDQYSRFTGKEFTPPALTVKQLVNALLLGNVQLIGNCIGQTEDLCRAIADYTAGQWSVVIDSVFKGAQAGAFLERTYNAPNRFGKVVYKYG
jgi:NADPH:quinone reductase-like Zn-dependent oxidoreductase